MPQLSYLDGASPRIVQQISIGNVAAGSEPELWKVPDGFFGRWRYLRWILTLNAGNATFRAWFINIKDPSGADAGQMIPGIAAAGGGGGVTNTPIHELLDASLPVLFDQVFQGGAGVQPAWDYSGMGALWYPSGFRFTFDATQLVAGDSVAGLNGMVELIETQTTDLQIPPSGQGINPAAWWLHLG